jgi:multiple sugar transport system substrate-binding protein
LVPDTSTKTSGSEVITFAASEFFETQYQVLIEDFELQHPNIHVQFVPLEEATPGETLEHSSAASLADAVMISPPQGADIYYYLDIEPILEADQRFDPSAFWPGSLDGCRAEGRLIGIPLSIQTLLLMYDRAAFDEMGLEYPAPGWGWEDFQAAAQALTQRSGGEVTRYGFVDYGRPTSLLAPLMDAVYRQNGNEFDPVKLANTLDWYVTLAQEGVIPTDYEGNDEDEVRDYISTGEAAMWVNALSSLEQRRQELGDSVGVSPFPEGGSSGNQQTTQAWATCGLVSSGTTQPQEAVTWLQFLAGQEIPGVNPTAIPANKAATEESGYWNKLDVNTATTVRYALEHGWYGAASNLPFEQIGEALNDAKTGEISLANALSMISVDQIAAIPPTPQSTPFAVATPKPPVISVPLSGDTIVVDYYVDSSDHADIEIIESLVQTFMSENPDIIIQLEDYKSSGLPYINFDLLAENYDCFAYQTGVSDYNAALIYNLQPLVDTDVDAQKLLNDLPEPELLLSRWNGDLYALPVTDRPTVLYYNKNLFSKHGVPFPLLKWDWNDFWQTAIAVASESNYGFVPLYGREFVDFLLASEGIDLYDLSKEKPVINFNHPKVISTFSLLEKMNKDGVIPVINDNVDWRKSNAGMRHAAVESGNAAMWLNTAGLELGGYFSTETLDFEVGVAPLPLSDYPLLSNEGGVSLFISNQSNNPTACWKWVKYLSDRPEAFIGIPLLRSVLESEQYEQIVGKKLAAVYRAAREQPRQEVVLEFPEWYPSYPLYLWWPETLTSVFDGVSVSLALTELQGKAETYLNCVKANSDPDNEDVWRSCVKQADPDYELPRIP